MDYCKRIQSLLRGTIFVLFFILSTSLVFSQKENGRMTDALNDFEMIESQNRFIEGFDGLGVDETSGQAFNLPIGIKKIAANIEFTLAITKIKFDNKVGTMSLLMKMYIPEKNKVLIFGADGVSISYNGDLVGDVRLSLLSDIPLSLGNAGDLVIKGGYDQKTGVIDSKTYVTLDCNGEFVELSIDGEIILNRNTFTAVNKDGTVNKTDSLVRSSVHLVVRDWNDIFTEVKLPSFEVKGAKGFIFNLESATLDLSDTQSPANFSPNPEYLSRYFPLPNLNLWRGLYIDKFSVTLPNQFKAKNSQERITIQAEKMLIDENGITGLISVKNVLPFEQGDASGWNFSVTDIKLEFLANNISGFGFGGQIGIPISSKKQVLDYEAFVSKDEYLIRASIGDSLMIDMFGDAKMKLEKTSFLEMKVKDKKFVPRIILDGQMNLNVDDLKGEAITFKKLSIGADAPILSIESMGYGGEIKLGNFPLTISDLLMTAKNETISLGFDAKVNLMEGKIAAGTRLTLLSEYKDNKFRFKGLDIGALMLENVEMGAFKLSGELRIGKDHPVYGNYFGGDIRATFSGLSDALKVDVKAIFGNTDFRYWYVEGDADFGKAGVPIGPVTINGFVGGVYYKMTGEGRGEDKKYVPYKEGSLGLKAGVSYSIANMSAISGEALFETNFLSTGGIKSMRFYGMAEIMAGAKLKVEIPKIKNMHELAMSAVKDVAASYTDKLPKNLSGSDVAKKVLVDVELKASIAAYLSMDFDFPTKTFDAEFKVVVDVFGFLTGTGQNKEAGWAKLHASPQTWYMHVGTPENPIGLKLGLKPLTLSSKSYFMFGDKLEKAALPPSAVLDIFGMSAADADYMKYPKNVSLGKGVAFGSRFEFDTGDMSFLIIYARFMAGIGFDVMLADMSDFACEGESSPVGMNGWYANGQCYAYLSGELGVRIKLFFIKKRITIIKGSTAALLQARIPNPTWIGGRLAVNLNVLGLIKLNMKMKMSFGNDCKLVRLDGDYSPLDYPIISDLTPRVGEEDIDVFFSPQATFNMGVGTPFEVEDEEGNPQSYRVTLENFYVMDNKGQKVEGKVKWDRSYESAVFESFEILPPNIDMKVEVSVNFEEFKNGRWQMVTHGGQNARESKIATFKTGGAPNYIPLTNIEYSYPVVDQKNFFLKETNEGYVQLKKGQQYLFPENFRYNTKFTDQNGNSLTTDFKYNVGERKVQYIIPNTQNKTKYNLGFVALPDVSRLNAESKPKEIRTSTTGTDADGESFVIDYTQQAAQQILKDGELEVLAYSIRSSEFNTFKDKMSSLSLKEGSRYISTGVHSMLLLTNKGYELFDEVELIGTDYTASLPLVNVESLLEDDYYNKDIAPITYNLLSRSPFSITERTLEYGVPPSKAFPLFDGYLNHVLSGAYSQTMSTIVPYVYELPYYYSLDLYELKTKAVNSFDKGVNMEVLKPILNGKYLFMRQGNYKTEFRYILPGGKKGSSIQLNYINSLDWR